MVAVARGMVAVARGMVARGMVAVVTAMVVVAECGGGGSGVVSRGELKF